MTGGSGTRTRFRHRGVAVHADRVFVTYRNFLFALDKASGRTVWETELPAGATGTPMTYMHAGKQYIVFAIGSQRYPAEFIAFALP